MGPATGGGVSSSTGSPTGGGTPAGAATPSVTPTPTPQGSPTAGAATVAAGAGTFVSIAPVRILDTRSDTGAVGPVGGYATVHLQVTGRAGVPATGVESVVLNLTETGATQDGYLTVYPDDGVRPTASNLNYPAGDTRANLVVVTPGADGRIAVTNTSRGRVQVIADLAGYYVSGEPTAAGTFAGLAPTRVLDTRTGNGASGPVAANSSVSVQIAGRGGVPSTGVSAVVLNLTETDARMGGYLTVYPDGTPRPTASNLNFPAGDTRANLVTVKLGDDGKIAIASTNRASVQLVGDIAGYYLAGSPSEPGTFTALSPTRILDTRFGLGAPGPVASYGTVRVQVTGRAGVPATGVTAVVLNLTETEALRGGYLTAYPDGVCEPGASNLNFPAQDTRANLVVVRVGADGMIALRNHDSGTLQLVADVAGYFTPNTVAAVTPTFTALAQQAISAKSAAWGSRLGPASGGLIVDGCVARQAYANAEIVYTNLTGAHGLDGPVYARYQQLGGLSATGAPITDVTPVTGYPGATAARFTQGALVSSDHGVRWMAAAIASYYFAHDGGSAFGAPIADTGPSGSTFPGDTITGFAAVGESAASAAIYHVGTGGTYAMSGGSYRTWSSLGSADGALGRPLSNESGDGAPMQRFTAGATVRGTFGWVGVYGDVWRVYSSATHLATAGDLGLPTATGSYWVQDFQNAEIDHGVVRVKVNATTHATTAAEVEYTWHSGCPVGASGLRTIDMNYLGFDARVHRGVMIVRSAIVGDVIDSFSAAAWSGFRIRQMVNPDHWLGDDYKMMAADNTSAFNCRKVSGNPYALSPHSYGTAVDINDFENPYEELGVWYPYKNWYATHRDASKPGVLVGTSTLTKKLVGHGFFWGANWSQPDYQHFQK